MPTSPLIIQIRFTPEQRAWLDSMTTDFAPIAAIVRDAVDRLMVETECGGDNIGLPVEDHPRRVEVTSTARGRAVESARSALVATDEAAKAVAQAYYCSTKGESEAAALEAVMAANCAVELACHSLHVALGEHPSCRLPAHPDGG